MWMLQLLLIALVLGTLLGIGWRIFDEWYEEYKINKKSNVVQLFSKKK